MRHNANGARLAVNSILRRGVTLQSERVMAFISKWSPLVDEIHLWFELDYGAHIRYLHRTGITRHLIRRRWCMQPFSYLAVLSDGSLSPCCQTSRVRFSAVGADAGLKAAMKHPEYLNFLEMHAQRRVEGTPCENCEAWLDDWLSDEIFSFGSGFSAAIEGSTARLTAFRDAG